METVNLEIDSCLEAAPAPVTVKYIGKAKDGSEPVLLEVTLCDPGWGVWRSTWRQIAAAQDDATGAHPDAIMIHAVTQSWSSAEPLRVRTVANLHPKVFDDLAKRALAIFQIKVSQAKNSDAPLTFNSTETSG